MEQNFEILDKAVTSIYQEISNKYFIRWSHFYKRNTITFVFHRLFECIVENIATQFTATQGKNNHNFLIV